MIPTERQLARLEDQVGWESCLSEAWPISSMMLPVSALALASWVSQRPRQTSWQQSVLLRSLYSRNISGYLLASVMSPSTK